MSNHTHAGNAGGIKIASKVPSHHTNPWRKKMRSARNSFIVACLALTALANAASATNYTLNANGNWTTPTIWTPTGVPTAGDSVHLSESERTLTVTSSESFGSTSVNSHFGFNTILDGTGGGVVTHVAGSTVLAPYAGPTITMLNLTFNNAGFVNMSPRGQIRLAGAGGSNASIFNNLATGLIGFTGDPIDPGIIRAGTLNNIGTMEVNAGTLRFDNAPQTTMLSLSQGGASLDYGTYRVIGNGVASTLNLLDALASDFGMVTPGEITNIGTAATVVLSSSGLGTADFVQLGPVGSISGRFLLYGTKSHTLSTSGTTVAGTVGGDGTFVAPGGLNLTGGTIDIESFSGGHGDLDVTGNVSFDSASSLGIDLGGILPGINYDQLAVDGTVSLGNSMLDLAVSFAPTFGTKYIILDNDLLDPITGIFQGLPEGAFIDVSGGGNEAYFTISYLGIDGFTGNDVVLTASIPEPSTVLLLLAGGVLALRRRGRS